MATQEMFSRCGELNAEAVVALEFSVPVAQAARIMRDTAESSVVVVDRAGRAIGILTDRDVAIRLVAEERDPTQTSIGMICTDPIATVKIDDDVAYAQRLMSSESLSHLPLIDDLGRPIGLVSEAQVEHAVKIDEHLLRRVLKTVRP